MQGELIKAGTTVHKMPSLEGAVERPTSPSFFYGIENWGQGLNGLDQVPRVNGSLNPFLCPSGPVLLMSLWKEKPFCPMLWGSS